MTRPLRLPLDALLYNSATWENDVQAIGRSFFLDEQTKHDPRDTVYSLQIASNAYSAAFGETPQQVYDRLVVEADRYKRSLI